MKEPDGVDLSAELPRLVDAYYSSDDPKELERLAGVITWHFLNQNDGAGLAATIQKLDPTYFNRAIYETAAKGVDISPLLPALMQVAGARDGHKPEKILAACLEPNPPERFGQLLLAIQAAPGTERLANSLLGEAQALGVDIAPGLPALLQFLGLHELRALAERGANLSTVVPRLTPQVAGRDRATAVLTSSALAFSALFGERWAELDALLGHASRNARWGAARALMEFLLERCLAQDRWKPWTEPVVDRLGACLADDDADVRKVAFEALEKMRKLGPAPRPSEAGLLRLVAALESGTEAADVLYGLLSGSDGEAERILAALRATGAPASEARQVLQRLCEESASGQLSPPCSICSNLERFECKGHEEDLPKEVGMLTSLPGDGEARMCPRCGTRYRYAWEETGQEDAFCNPYGTYNLYRLDPPPGTKAREELRASLHLPPPRPQHQLAAVPAEEPDSLAEALLYPDAAIRNAAIDRLDTPAFLGKDIGPEVVSRLVELISDRGSGSYSCRVLREASRGNDLLPHLPRLNALLFQGVRVQDVAEIVGGIQRRGGDITPALAGVADALGDQWGRYPAYVILLRHADEGKDLSTAVHALERTLEEPSLDDSHDRYVQLLVRHHHRVGDQARLSALRTHPRQRVQKAAERAVKELPGG